jgi:hypothetical protein
MANQTTYSTSDEWRRALSVADAVKQTASALQLEAKSEWLRQVLNEAADQMRAAVLWAAAQGSPAGKSHEALRPLIIAADAARSDASLASYFVSFLTKQNLIEPTAAVRIASELRDIEGGMETLSRHLRQELGFDPYEASTS